MWPRCSLFKLLSGQNTEYRRENSLFFVPTCSSSSQVSSVQLHVGLLPDALFFKFIFVLWMLLCAISRSTYFAVSYSGRLDCMLRGIKVGGEDEKYCRKATLVCTSLAWVMIVMSILFTLYSMFFTRGNMDNALAPITTYITVNNLLVPRILYFLFNIYLNAAWIFPHAMSFVLARIFTRQYKKLGQAFDKTLYKSDERRVSDSNIEMFRQNHQDISMHLSEADDFLMFHHAGAFCCQLGNVVLLLYILIFFPSTYDPVVLTMHIFWLFGLSSGLALTTAGGIMVNHYVSSLTLILQCVRDCMMENKSAFMKANKLPASSSSSSS